MQGDTPHHVIARGIRERGTERRLGAGETLCEAGQRSDRAYVVLEGCFDALVGDVIVAERGPGSVIGEVTALVGGARTATLLARGDAAVAEVESAVLHELLDDAGVEVERALFAEARDRTDRARVVALLQDQFEVGDPDAVRAIAERATWRRVEAGDDLFRVGDPSDSAYLLLSGRMEARTGDDRHLRHVVRGDIVGEFGLIEERPRTATVRAVRDCFLAKLEASDFQQISVAHPSVASALVRRVLDQAAGVRPLRHRGRVIAVADLTGAVSEVGAHAELAAALAPLSSTVALSPAFVDEAIGRPGIAQSEPGGVGEVRLNELLHELEQDHDQVLVDLETDLRSPWAGRALRSADLLVVLVPPDADDDVADRVRTLRASAPAVASWAVAVHDATAERPVGSGPLLERLGVDRLLHVRGRTVAEMGRVARLAAGRGVGVVLSGGGGRGHAHLGVLEALEDIGVPVDTIVGTSMGSVIAGVHAQGLVGAERRAIVAEQTKGLLDYTLPVVSLLAGKRISQRIEDRFGGWDVRDCWIPFACVSTSLTRSVSRQHLDGDLGRSIRASIAIPGVLPPVPADGELLIDGGVLDNLPVGLLLDDPAVDTVIASDVAPPKGPSAKVDYGTSVSGPRALFAQLRGRGAGYPGIVSTLLRSTLISSTRDRDRYVADGVIDCYLDLDLRGVGLMDFDAVDGTASRGRELAAPRLEAWWATAAANPDRVSDR